MFVVAGASLIGFDLKALLFLITINRAENFSRVIIFISISSGERSFWIIEADRNKCIFHEDIFGILIVHSKQDWLFYSYFPLLLN